MNEEDLFRDDIGSAIRRLNKHPRVSLSNTPSESAAAQRSFQFSDDIAEVAHGQTTWPVCIICYSSSSPIWQCKKCFVKACEACRRGKAGQGNGVEANWSCTSCGKNGADLNVLLQAPARRTSKVTKKGTSRGKSIIKQRTRKRRAQ